MLKIPKAPALIIPAFTPPAKVNVPSVPHPTIAPASSGKTKVAIFSGSKSTSNSGGKITSSSSLNHGSASGSKPSVKKNVLGQTLNPQGKPINAAGHLINDDNQRINPQGYAINDQHHLIDKQNRLVNKDNFLVDPLGRPLDKKGKIARSLETAVKGDVAPPVGQVNPSVNFVVSHWKTKVKENTAPNKPSSPVVKNIADLTQRMIDADKMIKAGVISKSPGIKRVAAETAASAAISGLVSAPISVGAYGASTTWGESIKASYLPLPLLPQAPGTKPIADHSAKTGPVVAAPTAASATEQVELDPVTKGLYERMDNLQVGAFTSTNNALALHHGSFAKSFLPSLEWPADPLMRITQLEDLLDRGDAMISGLADECQVYFKPLVPVKQAPEGVEGLAERIDTAERRLSAIDKAQAGVIDKLKALAPTS